VSGLMRGVASDIWAALISCRNPKAALATANGQRYPLTPSNRREIACGGSLRRFRSKSFRWTDTGSRRVLKRFNH
jgi:hypothetical protein